MGRNYRRFVVSTNRLPTLEHAIIGLCAEAGEAANIYKASLYKKRPLDKAALLLELGDVRWYLEACLLQLHSTLEQIEDMNIKKLEQRALAPNVPQSTIETRITALLQKTHPHLIPEKGDTMAAVLSKLAAVIEDLQRK